MLEASSPAAARAMTLAAAHIDKNSRRFDFIGPPRWLGDARSPGTRLCNTRYITYVTVLTSRRMDACQPALDLLSQLGGGAFVFGCGVETSYGCVLFLLT